MDPFKIESNLVESITARLREMGSLLSPQEVGTVVDLIKGEVLYRHLDLIISQAEAVLEIDPSLTEKEILQKLAKNVAEFLGAQAASIRIYDPGRREMVSFGSYPNSAENREEAIPSRIPSPERW